MGRKFKNQRRKKQNQEKNGSPSPEKKVKANLPYHTHTAKNQRQLYFQEFYRRTLKEDLKENYAAFQEILTKKLPVTFRVNSTAPNYQNFVKLLKNKEQIPFPEENASKRKKETTEEDLQAFKELNFEKVKWFPQELAWTLNVDREKFKKSQVFDKLHKFVQRSADAGLITRQELVSMMPPLLLDVKPTDTVLDVCAAPGSKTSQMMENQGCNATGCVIANDMDSKRAEMLIHQVQRINSQGILVLNHSGQFLPTLEKNNERFLYDKVLADVPCTGDGAVRKLPVKWEKWHTNDGLGIHSLQIQILLRSLSLCKVGGTVCYSTCSINPLEDEAVVAEVFRRLNDGCIELEDVHQKLPGFKGRRGLTHWPVLQLMPDICSKYPKPTELPDEQVFQEWENYEEYQEKRHIHQKQIITQSMFAQEESFMNKIKIQNTMRVMPHDQNTGGFYLALIKKKTPMYLLKKDEAESNKEKKMHSNAAHIQAKTDETKEKTEKDKYYEKILMEKQQAFDQRQNHQEKVIQEVTGDITDKKTQKQQFKTISDEDYTKITDYFGLTSTMKKSQFIQNVDGDKKILMVSESIAKLIEFDHRHQLQKVNMGVKIFSKQKSNFGVGHPSCPYRICQDGVLIMLQHMTKKKVKTSYKEFCNLLKKPTYEWSECSEQLQKGLAENGFGSMVIYIDEIFEGNRVVDAICVNNFTKNFNVMISKELYESYRLRYLH